MTTSTRGDTYKQLLLSAEEVSQEPDVAPDSSSVESSRPTCNKECTLMILPRIVTALLAASLVGVVFVLMPILAVNSAQQEDYIRMMYIAAGACVLITVPITVHGIVKHLLNWYMPQVQKFVVRILFMVPIFSIQSWFSLFFHGAYEYILTCRELYEAFVLASFVYYIIGLSGGEDQLVSLLRRKDAKYGKHVFPFRCFCQEWEMGRQFMMNCKYGVLQYVLVRIIATILIVILHSKGLYHSGKWTWTSSYTYISVVMNMSISYAMYCLITLYYATKEDLREWNPFAKFLCIKGVVFFTYWQGFVIELLCTVGVIKGMGDWTPQHVVDGITDGLLCLEMVFFAIAHRYSFPHTDYLHYLQRQRSKRSLHLHQNPSSYGESGALFLFDQDHNAVHFSESVAVDLEYQPPTMSQLDRPMSLRHALLGTVVPNETISDIARMGMSSSATIGDKGGRGAGDRLVGNDSDILISMDEAQLI